MDDHKIELAIGTHAFGESRQDDEFRELFVGMLGHDLRNPLAAILTSARLALRRGELLASDRKTIARIVSSGERMERMICGILDLTRSRQKGGIPLRSETKDLSEIAITAVASARSEHPGVVVELCFAPEGRFAAHVDASRIEQVLSTLIGHAIQRSPTGRSVRVVLRSDAVYVTISIHDDGPPIAHELQTSFFDAPSRAEPRTGHSTEAFDVNLYVAAHLVRAHGGAIHLVSSAERGTTFEFSVVRVVSETGAAP